MPARRLLLAVCALALTACTPLIDDPSSPTAAPAATETSGAESTTAEPQAATFELGEFDPEGDFELFDPCTEIPAEVLTEAGMGDMVGEPFRDRNLSSLCSFPAADEQTFPGLYSLTGDRATTARIEELDYMINPNPDSSIPGIYLHHMGIPEDNLCHAAVHTSRGRFHVGYGESYTGRGRDEACLIALQKLENIIHLLGENNGTVDQP